MKARGGGGFFPLDIYLFVFILVNEGGRGTWIDMKTEGLIDILWINIEIFSLISYML